MLFHPSPEKDFLRQVTRLNMTGRLCWLFLCVEAYLTALYPERDWSPVARVLWAWPAGYWDEGSDRCVDILPYLVLDPAEELGLAPEERQAFAALYAGLPGAAEEDSELNRVMSLPLDFSAGCEGTGLAYAAQATVPDLLNARAILTARNVPLPETEPLRRSRGLTGAGWGESGDHTSLSTILT